MTLVNGDDAAAGQPAKGALAIIFLVVFVDLLGFGVIIPLLPFYALNYQAGPLAVTVLFSVYSICQFIASPILGAMSDRWGRRPVLIFSQAGSAAGYALLGVVSATPSLSPHLAMLLIYLSRVIDGISGGNISTAQAYISDVTTHENRAKGMGMLGAAFGIGFAVGPAIGGLLGAVHPSWPAFAAAALSATAMMLTWLRLPESRVHHEVEAEAWLHPSRFAPAFKNPLLVQLLSIAFLSMAGFVMLESSAAMFLNRPEVFSWGPGRVGGYFAFIGVIIVIVQGGLIGRLTKAVGDWPLAIFGPIGVFLGMAALVRVGFHPSLLILFAGAAVNAAGRSLQTPTLYALISKTTDRRQQGMVFGLNQGLSSLARVIGPVIAGAVFKWAITGPYVVAGAIALIVFGWTGLLALRHSRAQAAATPVFAEPQPEPPPL